MSTAKDQLEKLKERILSQDGTVLDNVEGEVELFDTDEAGRPRLGPVLVLHSIEEGARLKLAHPRPITVLGTLSGQVFGAYRVKAGNLLSGRLEGVRHVEIVHDFGSVGNTNKDAWIVFEATSDPGFFSLAQSGLEKLRYLEHHQQPQREAAARQFLLRSLKDIPYTFKVFVPVAKEMKTVFAAYPARRGKEIEMDLKTLVRYLIGKVEQQGEGKAKDLVGRFQAVLRETLSESMRLANAGGIGAALRQKKGAEVYTPQIEALSDYLLPKLLQLWLKISEVFVQNVVDRLSEAPMTLQVDGQIAPFFQIEYPRWKFRVTGGKITPEKVADCNIACQLGDAPDTMKLTYNYVGDEDWISQTIEVALDKTQKCKLILKSGNVFLTEEDHCILGPLVKEREEASKAGVGAGA